MASRQEVSDIVLEGIMIRNEMFQLSLETEKVNFPRLQKSLEWKDRIRETCMHVSFHVPVNKVNVMHNDGSGSQM